MCYPQNTLKYLSSLILLFSVGNFGYAGERSIPYEIWGADQSNSESGAEARGVDGSFIWIWRSEDMLAQIKSGDAAKPLGCDGNDIAGAGPCDIKDVFPGGLVETNAVGDTNGILSDHLYGRLHGMLVDPQNRYLNVNLFNPGGGFVGIIDGDTKEAVALFRVSQSTAGRSVHMSFWNSDGSAILIANLNGKLLERIDITRNQQGRITEAAFNRSASLGVGKNMAINDEAKVFLGKNAQGKPMIGNIVGDYNDADLGDFTPAGFCRENGCDNGERDGNAGGRVNNVIICPIVSQSDKAYITLGGGGLLVADTQTTPMQLVGEYGRQNINGAGCGGVEVGNSVWLNAGVSASPAGATQSTFTIYSINDSAFTSVSVHEENTPAPLTLYKDQDPTDGNAANTNTIGNTEGQADANNTGQLPGLTSRRDSHGMAVTLSGRYVHTVDRIQNIVESIDTRSNIRTTYDLISKNGKGQGPGACGTYSVDDDASLPINDPAPDLIEMTPDGRFMAVALRGPIPVSVTHSAQGSCPGVGIVRLLGNGRHGKLVTVLRASNQLDDTPPVAPGGHDYAGTEHSDVHGASVRIRVEDQ